MNEPTIYEILGVVGLGFSILALVAFFGLARIVQRELERREVRSSVPSLEDVIEQFITGDLGVLAGQKRPFSYQEAELLAKRIRESGCEL